MTSLAGRGRPYGTRRARPSSKSVFACGGGVGVVAVGRGAGPSAGGRAGGARELLLLGRELLSWAPRRPLLGLRVPALPLELVDVGEPAAPACVVATLVEP